jgi:hypothetical protein
LTSYPVTLLYSFISSIHILEFLEFSVYKNISSANRHSFTSSFPTWKPFVPFPYLIALARTSSTMLNGSGENGHPCLVSDPGGKDSN